MASTRYCILVVTTVYTRWQIALSCDVGYTPFTRWRWLDELARRANSSSQLHRVNGVLRCYVANVVNSGHDSASTPRRK